MVNLNINTYNWYTLVKHYHNGINNFVNPQYDGCYRSGMLNISQSQATMLRTVDGLKNDIKKVLNDGDEYSYDLGVYETDHVGSFYNPITVH